MSNVSKSSVAPSRVVVLGSKGFIGSQLISRISSRWDTLGLSSSDIDLSATQSISSLQSIIRSDDIVVLISALTPDKGRDRKTLIKNIQMVDNFCSALEASRCRRLIYISSDAVYDDSAHLVSESSPCNPSSFHGVMHLTRERMLLQCGNSLGIPTLILRPCAVFGPGDTHNSYGPNRFAKTCLEKQEIALSGNGEEKRDHLFIADLVNIIELCIEKDVTGCLNVASGKAVSFKEAADLLVCLSPKKTQISFSPRQMPITHKHFDITALIQAFPELKFTPLESGLKTFFQTTNTN